MSMRIILAALALSTPSVPALAQAKPATAAKPAGPQNIAKSAFLSKIDQAFNQVDANHDGFTDKAEIESAEAKALAARKAQVLREREAAFKKLDADNNGSLTLAEFNAVASAQQLPKANATPFISRLDSNKDGKISIAENRAPAAAQFDKLDTNKDGILSPAEQLAAARRR